jgi:tripeptide aminopeptidase
MNLTEITADPRVRAARSLIQERDDETLREQLHLVSIAAPTGDEAERGAYVERRFAELGLERLHVDEVGNVIGTLPQPDANGSAHPVILAAHLDTVFPAGTALAPRTEGSRIIAPGITDNARGLAGMLALAAVLREAGIATHRPVIMVATVGEEGLGDLRGVKHLFREGSPMREAAAFVSLDGAGISRIVNRAIGATRLRATISGIGGHSWGDRGRPNPAHALGLAIAGLRALQPPHRDAGSLSVGRLGGGTSVNAIPSEAWLELDLRSENGATLAELESSARAAFEEATRRENGAGAAAAPLSLEIETIGARPGGITPPESDLVRVAVEATRMLGGAPQLTASSTDANVPIALGIPAVAIGAGGQAGGVHTEGEWYENGGGVQGIERALLTLVAAAGLHGRDQAD